MLSSFLQICFVFLFLVACTSQSVIVHDLREREANEILTYLNEHNIDAVKEKSEGGGGAGGQKDTLWDIKVGSEHSNEAMALLNAAGLPRRRGENLLGIFANGGLVPSEMQEQIRYQAGLSEQLSSVIRKFDGVIDADVQLSFPKEDPLNPRAAKNAITAAVYVKHNGVLDDPNSHLESKIRRLVSNGVPNLSFDNVTVVGERTRYGPASADLAEIGGTSREKPLVYIWSMIIAKESVTRFRVLFFSFFMAILVLLLFLFWLLWKLYPVLHNAGGLGKLFSFEPLAVIPPKKEEEEEKKEEDTSSTPPTSS